MTFFLKFHLYLAQSNKTTIENIEKKGRPFKSPYDIGGQNNWYQIFGTNRFLWPFPLFAGSGKPLGDGIYWPTNTKIDDDDKHHLSQSQQKESEQTKSPTKRNFSPNKSAAAGVDSIQSKQNQQRQYPTSKLIFY